MYRESVFLSQRIGDNAACHDGDRHPDRYLSLRGKVNPKGVFNDSVGNRVEESPCLGGFIASTANNTVYGIKRKDDGDGEYQRDVKSPVTSKQGDDQKS